MPCHLNIHLRQPTADMCRACGRTGSGLSDQKRMVRVDELLCHVLSCCMLSATPSSMIVWNYLQDRAGDLQLQTKETHYGWKPA